DAVAAHRVGREARARLADQVHPARLAVLRSVGGGEAGVLHAARPLLAHRRRLLAIERGVVAGEPAAGVAAVAVHLAGVVALVAAQPVPARPLPADLAGAAHRAVVERRARLAGVVGLAALGAVAGVAVAALVVGGAGEGAVGLAAGAVRVPGAVVTLLARVL